MDTDGDVVMGYAGTSLSAPLISSLAAFIKYDNPNDGPAAIRAKTIKACGRNPPSGGLANFLKAVISATK